MTFYGEALGLDWANAITGTIDASGEPMHYLYRDTTAQAVVGGDSFIAGIFPNAQQLTSGDEAVISWAVEVSGSGVLAFSSGLDPTWNLDTPSYASESLGSVTVSGTQRIVLAQTTITAADILAEASEPILYVQCTSGSLDIAQVRLRVWPVGGPAGAWAPGGSFSELGSWGAYHAAAAGSVYGYSGPGGAAPAGRAAFGTATPSAWTVDSTPDIGAQGQVAQDNENDPTNPNNWGANFGKDVAYLRFEPSVVTTTTAGAAGTHPDIVPGDYGGSVRAIGGGPLYSQFGSWNGGVRVTQAIYTLPRTGETGTIGASLAIDPAELTLTPTGTSGEYSGSVPFPSGGATYAVDDVAPLPATASMVIGVESGIWYTDPPDERQDLVSAALESVSVTALVPAHEWWDPSLPWVERQPRFFVKDYEGAWRPVGFGKPASDTSRFHVWTPVGWYVECLDGETYSNAHPLKVKLYDGTWDTVAHMRPL